MAFEISRWDIIPLPPNSNTKNYNAISYSNHQKSFAITHQIVKGNNSYISNVMATQEEYMA